MAFFSHLLHFMAWHSFLLHSLSSPTSRLPSLSNHTLLSSPLLITSMFGHSDPFQFKTHRLHSIAFRCLRRRLFHFRSFHRSAFSSTHFRFNSSRFYPFPASPLPVNAFPSVPIPLISFQAIRLKSVSVRRFYIQCRFMSVPNLSESVQFHTTLPHLIHFFSWHICSDPAHLRHRDSNQPFLFNCVSSSVSSFPYPLASRRYFSFPFRLARFALCFSLSARFASRTAPRFRLGK